MTRKTWFSSLLAASALVAFSLPALGHGPGSAATNNVSTSSSSTSNSNPGGGGAPGGSGTPGGAAGAGGGAGVTPGGGGNPAFAGKKASGGAGRFPTQLGRNNRSPAAVRSLDLHWIESAWPRETKEGYGESVLPLHHLIHTKCLNPYCTDMHCRDFACTDPSCMREKRPAMVYLYDPAATRESKLENERRMFGDDGIGAMTAFVHAFSVAANEVEMREYQAQFGTKLPALIFMHPNGRTIRVLEGKISQDQVESAFDAVFDTCFGRNRKATVEQYMEIVARLEKAEDACMNAGPRLFEIEARAKREGEGKNPRTEELLKAARERADEARRNFDRIESERVELTRPALVVAKTNG